MYEYLISPVDYQYQPTDVLLLRNIFDSLFDSSSQILILGYRENFFSDNERLGELKYALYKSFDLKGLYKIIDKYDNTRFKFIGLISIQDLDVLIPWEYFEALSLFSVKDIDLTKFELICSQHRKLFKRESSSFILDHYSDIVMCKGVDDQDILFYLKEDIDHYLELYKYVSTRITKL